MSDQIKDKRKHKFVIIDKPIFNLGLTPAEFVVYAVLAYHADNDSNESYPAIKTISKLANISLNTVKKALDRLARHNLISIEPRIEQSHNGKMNQLSHIYTLLDVEGGSQILTEGGDQILRKGLSQILTEGGDQILTPNYTHSKLDQKQLDPPNGDHGNNGKSSSSVSPLLAAAYTYKGYTVGRKAAPATAAKLAELADEFARLEMTPADVEAFKLWYGHTYFNLTEPDPIKLEKYVKEWRASLSEEKQASIWDAQPSDDEWKRYEQENR